MSRGPLHAAVKAPTLDRSDRSSAPTVTAPLPVLSRISAATRSPASVLRTASVTAAPASASARAVSTPIPDDAPVTMARLPDRSTPARTSAAVDSKPKGVLIKSMLTSVPNILRSDGVPRHPDRALSLRGDACNQRARGVELSGQVDGLTCPDRQVVAVAAVGGRAEFRQRALIGLQRGLVPLPGPGEAVAQGARG